MLFTRVFFRALFRTDFGERVAVVGSSPALGNWQVSHCHELTTNEDVFPSWFSKEPVYLPLRKSVSYKYVVLDERGDIVRWESCEGNRELVPTGVEMTVEDDDGLFREQMTSRGDRGVEGDDDVSVTAQDKEETEARNRMLAIQEEEPQIDENDTLVLCAVDLPIRVRRTAPPAAAAAEAGSAGSAAGPGAAREGGGAAGAAGGGLPGAAGGQRAASAAAGGRRGAEGKGGGGAAEAGDHAAASCLPSSHAAAAAPGSSPTSASVQWEPAAGADSRSSDSSSSNDSSRGPAQDGVSGGGNGGSGGAAKGRPVGESYLWSLAAAASPSSGLLKGGSSSSASLPSYEYPSSWTAGGGAAAAGAGEHGSSSGGGTEEEAASAGAAADEGVEARAAPGAAEAAARAAGRKGVGSISDRGGATAAVAPLGGGGGSALPTSLSADSLVNAALLRRGGGGGAAAAAGAGGGGGAAAGPLARSRRGKFEVLPSKNALLPALYRLRHKTRQPVLFIGWPGIDVEDETEQQELIEFLRPFDCVPVFPDKEDFQKYLSFCHRFLWPLFHNVLILDTKTQEPFDSSLWSCYQAVNKLWADAVLKHAHESDLIWVHDFHLLLAPMHITRRVRKANVGFFLHIPFPSSEIFRCLPCREDILRGMLCADLVGFHLFEYARHFLVACKRLLGLEHHFCRGGVLSIEYGGRNVSIRIGHVHIQYEDVRQKISSSPVVAKMVAEIRQKYGDKFIFVAVDRCERLAGLLLKVRAFEKFLETYSYAKGRVVLIQYAYPTLNYFDDGEEMRAELEELVDGVNKRFATKSDEQQDSTAADAGAAETTSFNHIDLRVQPVGWEEKCAVFLAGDCFLDTSIRDGLNLNPFEFICCHKDHVAGVILSEFTGCSRALASAIRVNPWKVEGVADAMDRVINLPIEEQRDRFLRDQEYLSRNSTQRWAEENVRDLRRARKPDDFVYVSWGLGNTFRVLGMDSNFRFLETNVVLQAYRTSRHRAFFFDCEGTLAPDRRRIPFVSGGGNLFAQGRPPSAQVKACLHALLNDQKNTVVILSGRDRHLLEEWFSSLKGIGLCAEHGFYFRVYPITGDQWQCMSRQRDFTWKQVALELMLQYVKRTQGSFIENKGSALVFQYRDADPDFGSMQAKDLSNYLSELLFGYPVSVMSGKGYVEVKLRGVNKGHAVEKVLRKLSTLHGDVDFVLCVGDDRSDEDMFAVINAMSEDGDQLSLPEGSGACSSGLYRHPQSKDRICRRSSVSSDEASWQRQLQAAPHRAESTPSKSSQPPQQKLKSSGMFSLPLHPSSASSLSGGQLDAAGSPNSKKKKVSHFFTCTVGKKPSNARYYLNDTDDVSDLLEVLRQCAEKDSQQLYTSKESGAAPAVAAAAAAGSMAGNVAVQLRKGSEGAGTLAGLWMRSALGNAAAAVAAGGRRAAAAAGKAGGEDGLAGGSRRGQESRDGVAPS